MKALTYNDLLEIHKTNVYRPDPYDYFSKNWEGTVLDILDNKKLNLESRIYYITSSQLVSEKLLRLFGVWCARQVQYLLKDEFTIKSIDIAEKYANGRATKEELMNANRNSWNYSSKDDPGYEDPFAKDVEEESEDSFNAKYAATYASDTESNKFLEHVCSHTSKIIGQEKVEENLKKMILEGIKTGDVK